MLLQSMKSVAVVIETDPNTLSIAREHVDRLVDGAARVEAVSSIAAAEALLTELKDRGEAVSLVIVNHGRDLAVAQQLLDRIRIGFPDARTIVLCSEKEQCSTHTHGADEEIVVGSWDTFGERLTTAIRSAVRKRTSAEGNGEVTIVGDQWSPRSHEVKDLLCRHRIPYRWVDVERAKEAPEDIRVKDLPLLVFPDGSRLECPDDEDIAEKLGFSTEAESEFYDLVIVGGGPAGLAAAVYGASEGLRVIVIEREAPGGQAGASSLIENYLGFPEGLSGAELAQRAVAQARRFNAEILLARDAVSLRRDGGYCHLELDDGSDLASHCVLISTGVDWKRLEVDGAESLQGRGIYYGATLAEAARYEDEDVALLGGGNSAGQAAMLLARYAAKVRMIMVEEKITTMSRYLIDRLKATPNIEIMASTTITAVEGEESLEAVTVKNTQTDQEQRLQIKGLFIWIGVTPRTEWLQTALAVDDDGFVLAGRDLTELQGLESWPLDRWPFLLETSMPGVFVAGDVRHGSVKRIGSAVGEGAMAIQMVHQYLRER
jgi:thioredoxin reductase (NADPH)